MRNRNLSQKHSFHAEDKVEPKLKNLFEKFTFSDDADPFASEKFPKTTNGNGDNNNNFDPFGAPITSSQKKDTTSTSTFGFEGDFANFEDFNDTPLTTNGNNTGIVDAWGSLDKKNNNVSNSTGKIQKFKAADISKVSKFSGDYSDNFDNDLKQVLQRSVTEK